MRLVLSSVLLGAAVIGLMSGPVFAASFPEKPEGSDFFVDGAVLMDEETSRIVNETALSYMLDMKSPMYVVTIGSLAEYDAAADYTADEYAEELYVNWKIGEGNEAGDRGALLLVSRDDRQARIELGVDLDRRSRSYAGRVMRGLINPHFLNERYSMGIADGVKGMLAMARGEEIPKPTKPLHIIIGHIVFISLIIFAVISLMMSGGHGIAAKWSVIIVIAIVYVFLRPFKNVNFSSIGRSMGYYDSNGKFVGRSAGSYGGGFGGGFSGGGGATGSW